MLTLVPTYQYLVAQKNLQNHRMIHFVQSEIHHFYIFLEVLRFWIVKVFVYFDLLNVISTIIQLLHKASRTIKTYTCYFRYDMLFLVHIFS